MSGIGEAITVIACIAALVSAYKDGGTILSKIRDRRAKRGGLPPTKVLEEELKRGEHDIEAAAKDGRDHYGHAFELGDGTLNTQVHQQISL